MHIKRLMAENFKRLRVADISPRGHIVQVTGKNGSGKTSTLDAIAVALGGLSLADPEPIHTGAPKATVKVTLSDGQHELLITRTFTPGGSELRVEDQTGRLSSPQKVLDALIGHLAFDPLEFTRKAPKAQLETLRRLVPLEVDIDKLDAENKVAYEERASANKEAKQLRARLEAEMDPPDGTPDEELDSSDVQAQIKEASAHNGKVDAAYKEREEHAAKIATVEARIENGKKLLEQLEVELAELKAKGFDELPPRVDTQALVEQLANVSKINDHVRKKKQLVMLRLATEEREEAAKTLTAEMEERERIKREAIMSAKMPVDGLSFGEGQVLFNGLPLQQASQAEQIRVSVAIGMAMNPKLRVLHIHDGSLLDEDSLQLVADMAATNDYQVWLEKVDSSGKVGIVIEDGMVVADYQAGPDLTFNRAPKAVPDLPAPKPVKEKAVPRSTDPGLPDGYQNTDPNAPNYLPF